MPSRAFIPLGKSPFFGEPGLAYGVESFTVVCLSQKVVGLYSTLDVDISDLFRGIEH